MTPPTPQVVWNQLRGNLQTQVSVEDFNTWFQRLTVDGVANDELILSAPNEIIRDWLESHYSGVILDAATKTLGHPTNLRIVVRAAAPATIPATPARPASSSPAAQTQELLLSPQHVFDNFVQGPSNRLSYAASLAVAEAPGAAYNPLFLHGAVGLGKTHLLQAICHAVLRQQPQSRVQFVSCEQFVNHFIACIRDGNLERFRAKYRNADLLVIDDIQFLSEKERCQEEFFHTFNTLHMAQKQIVLASDAPPQELKSVEERLISRFKSGLVAHLEAPHYETRCAILQKKAELRGMQLPPDVVNYVATNIRANVREIEGAVMKLISYAHLMNRTIDLAMATEALSDLIQISKKTVTAQDIQAVIMQYFNLRPNDLQSPRRTQSIAFPRQICMYLIRQLTDASLEEIGDLLGGRDHTTVLYAVEKIGNLRDNDNQLRNVLQNLQVQLQKA